MKLRLSFFTILSIIFGLAAQAQAQPDAPTSALAKLAASMKPGTFALLNHHGDDSGYTGTMVAGLTKKGRGVGSIYGYSQKAVYDPKVYLYKHLRGS